MKVSDGTHASVYDAVVISVSSGSNPTPTLSSISPTTAAQNSGAFTLTLTGGNFVPASQVTWNGQPNLIAATATNNQITVTVPGGYLSTAGTPTITVFNPTPGGGTSSGQTLTITAAAPPAGGGGSAGGGTSGGGGCGLGGAVAVLLALGMLTLSGRR